MTALTADLIRRVRDQLEAAVQAHDASEIFVGSFTAIGSKSNATAGKQGRAFPWTKTAGEIPGGMSMTRETGDLTPTTGLPIPEAKFNGDGEVLEKVDVAGVTAQSDVGSLVFLSDDGDGLTLSRTAPSIPIGVVIRFISGTQCDVWRYPFSTLCALAICGSGSYEEQFVVSGNFAVAGNAATGIVMRHHGVITDVYGEVIDPFPDPADDLSYNLELNGTNVTGGVVNVTGADARGSKKSGTVVSAFNVFHEGDLLDIEVAVANASAGGLVAIHVGYVTRLGL